LALRPQALGFSVLRAEADVHGPNTNPNTAEAASVVRQVESMLSFHSKETKPMFRRSFLTLVAALATAAVLGAPTRAQAGFRVTINATGAGSPAYFYSNSSNSAAFAGFTVGNFTANIQTDSSNFSGSASLGSLSQTLIIGNSGAGGNIDVLLEVVNNVALADGQVTGAGNIATLLGATVSLWSLPVGNPLGLSSDVSVATNASTTAGSVLNETKANSTTLNSLSSFLNPAQNERITFTSFDGSAGYTLQNHIIVTSINAGAAGTSITAVSGVAAPAPAGLVLLLSAAPAAAFGWYRRRKTQAETV